MKHHVAIGSHGLREFLYKFGNPRLVLLDRGKTLLHSLALGLTTNRAIANCAELLKVVE
jgi:hypothetical protein